MTRLVFLALLASTAPLAAQGAQPQPLTAKLTETLMGPLVVNGQPARFFLSEDGNHIALVGTKGSRQVVLLDGVEGPAFDEIPTSFINGQGSVYWSPTGGHSGYVGRRGGDYIAVVDGREAATVATSQTQVGGYGTGTGWRFWFSHDGAKMAYAVMPEAGAWIMLDNGVKSPIYKAIDFGSVQLHGIRLVYAAQSLDSQWHVVADGKPGPGYAEVSGLTVTPDGAHYAYIAQRNVAGQVTQLAVNDGVEGKPYKSVGNLEQAPDGRIAYVVAYKPADITPAGGPGGLWVGGTVYPRTTTFNLAKPGAYSNAGFSIQYVAWSADGKRAAWIQTDPFTPGSTTPPGVTVLVNGKPMGPTYAAAGELHWSPDGSHLAYVARSPSGTFPVIDGQEGAAYNLIHTISFGADGARVLILGSGQGGPIAVLDGKPQPKAMGFSTTEYPAWSPDGKHVAWGAQNTVSTYAALVDGVARPGSLGNFMAMNYAQPRVTFPQLVWSPDGTHLAYVAQRMDGTGKQVVYLDNTAYEGPPGSYTYPSFSPDSKHFAAIMTTGTGWLAFIDGKVSPAYQDMLKGPAAAARFIGPLTYRFYGVKAGMIYRVTLEL
ncbi:MAG TPA: hypothetical protein VFU23_12880, partial [Gemmatimonadales bacterium]|nr:hypothetical protein [Gemmatimonadales bacterium]